MRTILLVKTSSLGDVVHNFPAASDIARHFPDARIDWVVEEAYAPLVRLHPAIDRVLPIAIRRWRGALSARATWREMFACRAQIRARAYDAVIDTQGLVKSALVTKFARGPRYGLARGSAREPLASQFYDRAFDVARSKHAIARCRELVAIAMGYVVDGNPRYGLRIAHCAAADRQRVVLLHGTARPEKQWPEADWIALGGWLNARGIEVIVPWGDASERTRSERIAGSLTAAEVPSRRSLDALAEMLASATAVIGVDTGLLHLAVALKVPTVAIFCATDPALTGPLGEGAIAVCGGLGQRPDSQDVRAAFERVVVGGA